MKQFFSVAVLSLAMLGNVTQTHGKSFAGIRAVEIIDVTKRQDRPAGNLAQQPVWENMVKSVHDPLSASAADRTGSEIRTACEFGVYRPTRFLSARVEFRRASHYGRMRRAACLSGVPVGLFDAMIIRESAYRHGATSSKKAYGLTQLMPGTADQLGVDRYDVDENLWGGARYLRQQLDRFGRVSLALAAYNAGPGRVRNGMIPPFAETRAYVSDILDIWNKLGSRSSSAVIDLGSNPGVGKAVRAAMAIRRAQLLSF